MIASSVTHPKAGLNIIVFGRNPLKCFMPSHVVVCGTSLYFPLKGQLLLLKVMCVRYHLQGRNSKPPHMPLGKLNPPSKIKGLSLAHIHTLCAPVIRQSVA